MDADIPAIPDFAPDQSGAESEKSKTIRLKKNETQWLYDHIKSCPSQRVDYSMLQSSFKESFPIAKLSLLKAM